MEILATKLSKYISKHMNYDDDKQSVIAYGLTALFQMVFIAIAISIVGILADFWCEAIIIFLGVGFLRKSTGGIHSQTLIGCTVISIVSISTLSALCRYILMYSLPLYIAIPVYLIIIIFCFYIAYHKVPVDTPNKPIKKIEKIKRLRKQSFITITIYSVIILGFAFLSINNLRFSSLACSFLCALLWQTFTLTKLGAIVINSLDSLFKKG